MTTDSFSCPDQFKPLLQHLSALTGLGEHQLRLALARKAQREPMEGWQDWMLEQAVAWVLHLWRLERSECSPRQLWQVDCKYSRLLKHYTVSEVVRLLASPE